MFFYRVNALACPNHRLRACGDPEDIAPTTIFNMYGVNSSSGGQERHTLNANFQLSAHHKFSVYVLHVSCSMMRSPTNRPAGTQLTSHITAGAVMCDYYPWMPLSVDAYCTQLLGDYYSWMPLSVDAYCTQLLGDYYPWMPLSVDAYCTQLLGDY